MSVVGNGKLWIIVVLMVIFMTSIVASVLPQTEEVRLGLLVWQQFLFLFGGMIGAYKGLVFRLDRKTMLCAIVSGIGLYLVNLFFGFISIELALRILDFDLVQEMIMREQLGAKMLLASNKPPIFFGMVLLLTVGAPIGEEMFFRGLLVGFWKKHLGAKKAIFFSALIFGLLHFYTLQFIPVLISGILLGVLFLKTGNVLVPIIAHSVTNCLVLFVWLFRL